MFGFADRARIERRLQVAEEDLGTLRGLLADLQAKYLADVSTLQTRVRELEGEEFALTELRRQARNAVRSLERAAANVQDAPGRTNGGRRGVEAGIPPIEPPGPRRNY